MFEITQAISLYWFAAQQRTSISRRQKVGLSYTFKKRHEVAKKAKTKTVQKTVYKWNLGANG